MVEDYIVSYVCGRVLPGGPAFDLEDCDEWDTPAEAVADFHQRADDGMPAEAMGIVQMHRDRKTHELVFYQEMRTGDLLAHLRQKESQADTICRLLDQCLLRTPAINPLTGDISNAQRVEWAKRTLDHHLRLTTGTKLKWLLEKDQATMKSAKDDDLHTAIKDLVADLGHLASVRGYNFELLLEAAVDTCNSEREDENTYGH